MPGPLHVSFSQVTLIGSLCQRDAPRTPREGSGDYVCGNKFLGPRWSHCRPGCMSANCSLASVHALGYAQLDSGAVCPDTTLVPEHQVFSPHTRLTLGPQPDVSYLPFPCSLFLAPYRSLPLLLSAALWEETVEREVKLFASPKLSLVIFFQFGPNIERNISHSLSQRVRSCRAAG